MVSTDGIAAEESAPRARPTADAHGVGCEERCERGIRKCYLKCWTLLPSPLRSAVPHHAPSPQPAPKLSAPKCPNSQSHGVPHLHHKTAPHKTQVQGVCNASAHAGGELHKSTTHHASTPHNPSLRPHGSSVGRSRRDDLVRSRSMRTDQDTARPLVPGWRYSPFV